MRATGHPEDKLLEFAYGELSAPDARAVEHHLASCPDCARSVAMFQGVRKVMAPLGAESPHSQGLDSLRAYASTAAARRKQPGARWHGRWLFTFTGVAVAACFVFFLRSHPGPLAGSARTEAVVPSLVSAAPGGPVPTPPPALAAPEPAVTTESPASSVADALSRPAPALRPPDRMVVASRDSLERGAKKMGAASPPAAAARPPASQENYAARPPASQPAYAVRPPASEAKREARARSLAQPFGKAAPAPMDEEKDERVAMREEVGSVDNAAPQAFSPPPPPPAASAGAPAAAPPPVGATSSHAEPGRAAAKSRQPFAADSAPVAGASDLFERPEGGNVPSVEAREAQLQAEIATVRGAAREARLMALCRLSNPPRPASMRACQQLLIAFPQSQHGPEARAILRSAQAP